MEALVVVCCIFALKYIEVKLINWIHISIFLQQVIYEIVDISIQACIVAGLGFVIFYDVIISFKIRLYCKPNKHIICMIF